MKDENTLYLRHILDAIKDIETYVRGLNEQKFLSNKLVQDAVIRNLEIIGEATKKIEKVFKTKNPQIEWRKIAGMRDVLIHDYLGVDPAIVWRVIKNRLPQLKKDIRAMVE